MEADEDACLNDVVVVVNGEKCDRGVVDDWYNNEAEADETTVGIVLGVVGIGAVTAQSTDDNDDEDWLRHRFRS